MSTRSSSFPRVWLRIAAWSFLPLRAGRQLLHGHYWEAAALAGVIGLLIVLTREGRNTRSHLDLYVILAPAIAGVAIVSLGTAPWHFASSILLTALALAIWSWRSRPAVAH